MFAEFRCGSSGFQDQSISPLVIKMHHHVGVSRLSSVASIWCGQLKKMIINSKLNMSKQTSYLNFYSSKKVYFTTLVTC